MKLVLPRTLLLAASALSPFVFANEVAPDIQVEVIIFSQQDFYKNEQPRLNIELAFPANAVLLADPALEQTNAPIEPISCPEPDADDPSEQPIDPITDLSEPIKEEALETLEPVVEKPYILLDKTERSLNPDAYTLQRAPGYRVLFHQAWRQTKQPKNKTPWVLIRGGKQTGDHFELEGAIRLYQSRYPHFQTNIWKATLTEQYTNTLPTTQQPKTVLKAWPTLPKFPITDEIEPVNNIPNCLSDILDDFQQPTNLEDETIDAELLVEEIVVEKTAYKVEHLVKLEQAHRADYDKLLYLDHPEMGVLVLITDYEATVVKETDINTIGADKEVTTSDQ